MTGLGIYHYQSWFYSPKLGRFLSADTIVPNPFNPQDFNRYSYVRNNPVRYIDPSGHRACITPEECADMGITPSGGSPSKPKLASGGGRGGGGRRGEDTPDPNPNNLPSPVVLPDGGVPESDAPVVIANPDPLDGGLEQDDPSLPFMQTPEEGDGSPLVSLAGLLLLVNLGALDIVLGYGIAMAATAGPLGWAMELILVPLEFVSIELTIYAAQVAATGRTDHDPLFITHAVFPEFLPYEP